MSRCHGQAFGVHHVVKTVLFEAKEVSMQGRPDLKRCEMKDRTSPRLDKPYDERDKGTERRKKQGLRPGM